jgi:probable HAF family extracellular repeat protein
LKTLDFPQATFTQALGLNDVGAVVGAYLDSAGASHGFVYDDGRFVSVDDPEGVGTTIVNGINNHGQLVGFYVDTNTNTDGFIAAPR